MFTFPRYDLAEILSEEAGTSVFRAKERQGGRAVVLKVVPAFASEQRRTRLRHEFELLKEFDCPDVVGALELMENEQALVLVQEDIGGTSLNVRLAQGPLTLKEFFPIALGLTVAVEQVHHRQIIHRDINPRNVVWNPASGRLQLIDFGRASRLSREQAQMTAPNRIEGSLPYLAPEQTGRMNRVVDYRADFYALGATFYELLTGRMLFSADDALEWVHCHLARQPRPPVEVLPTIPRSLSDIVLKLLAKLAEDRYQSATGLRADLERCQREWRETGAIQAFPLGEADVSDRFQLPQKLYGRQAEVAALLSAFDRVAATGRSEVLLISGFSGVGKSALVAELHKPIMVRRGYFISGKFDQYQRGIPYASLAVAFRALIQQVLNESEAEVAHWRQRLLAALGENGRLMIDLVPQVELIIGPQPPVADLPPDQAQHRLLTVFEHFVGAFAAEAHPLALFLDDLQWIDSGSLKLLTRLSVGVDMRYLLVLGAYRDNEVSAEHPLMTWLEALRRAAVAFQAITLAPLAEQHVVAIVTDTTHCDPEHAALLAHLVFEKTRGNPFFCFQFLTALFHDGLLAFEPAVRGWRWDFAAIDARNFTDNVVELMLGELHRLPLATQAALTVAGFLGNEFSLARLALVIGESEDKAAEVLWPALKAGLVVRQGLWVRFLHDRVQEAAYALTPVGKQAAVHAHIGRLLRDRMTRAELEEELFELIGHLNQGRVFFIYPSERWQLARLNLRAGRKARAATVYAAAAGYLAVGISLLPEDAWMSDYKLAFALHLAHADCEYLAGNFAATDEGLEVVLAHARSPLDRAKAHLIKISLCMARGDNPEACNIVQISLHELGLALPARPTLQEVEAAHAQIATLMTGHPLEQLLDLPEMTDPAMKMALRILVLASTAAIFTDQELWSFQDAQMVLLCLRHGNTDVSVMAYLFYGFMLGAYLHRYQDGYRFCEIAYTLMERSGLVQHRGNLVYHQALAALWVRPISQGIAMMKESIPFLTEYGNLVIACLAYRFIVLFSLLKGDPLGKVNEEAERCRIFAAKAPYPMVIALNHATQRLIHELQGLPEDQADEECGGPRSDGTDRVPFVIVAEHLSSLAGHCIMNRFFEAGEALRAAEPLLWAIPGLLPNHDYYYYGSLTLAVRHADAPPEERAANLATMRANEGRLRIWSENQPATFASSHLLIQAEIARLTDRALEAMPLYEQSITAARNNGLLSHEALACETAAGFYEQHGVRSAADLHRRAARSAYLRWGAEAKVRLLDLQYPELRGFTSTEALHSFGTDQAQLDILAVVKATQAISRQIVGDQLLKTLLETVLEQAGAQFGALLLVKDEDLGLTATAEVTGENIEVQLAPATERLPASVLAYVQRTLQPVVLDDARSAHSFSADPVLGERAPLAVLCLPILQQGGLIGALYLEHRNSTHVFSLGQCAILEQLAAQAAISLQNAQLYARSIESEKTLRQQSERLRLLSAIDRAILAATSLDRICTAVLEGAIGLVPARRASITLYDEERRETVRFVVEQGEGVRPAERLSMITEIPSLLPVDDVVVLEDIRLIDDPHPILEQLRAIGLVSILVAPIIIAGQLRGRLNFSAEQAHIFTTEHREIAGDIAAQLAIATQQHRLHEDTRLHAIELERRVAERTAELEAANQELESFGYSVSHDLRAPLRAIDWYSTNLVNENRERLDAEGQRQCDIIRSETRRMGQLIDDLLAFARLGRTALRTVVVDMRLLAAEVFEEVMRGEDESRVEFRLGALPPAVGDPALLRQVWANLLSNAVKYSSKKKRAHIAVEGERLADVVRYRVRDNGAGFDMAYAKKLFGVFQRMHGEEEFSGTGVGLAIVQRIVQRHGGAIEADSALNVGTTFTFTLTARA